MATKAPKQSRQPWAPADIAALGTATDREIAASLGRSVKAVERKRRDLGVAAFTPHTRTWTARELAMLGKHSDAAVAKRLGISRRCVLQTRRRLGIGPACPANTPTAFRT